MENYDALKTPDPDEWLALDEGERINLVTQQHEEEDNELPDVMAHANFHVIVENQLAMDERTVKQTLARLRRQGLDRHEAIHAIAAVLAEHLYDHPGPDSDGLKMHQYYGRLKRLTAKRWLKGKW